MNTRLALLIAVVGCATACSSSPKASPPTTPSASVSPTAASSVAPSPSAISPAPSTAPTPAQKLPVVVSSVLSSADQDSSILEPSTCGLSGSALTATGTFNGGIPPEGYIRYGDVVELYAYNGGPPGTGTQVADLASEAPFIIGNPGPWIVTATVAPRSPAPQSCYVAVQSTHAFMGAGSAGG